MAIALSFGTVASTFVVLLLIPALHAIWYDVQLLLGLTDRRQDALKPPDRAEPADDARNG
jgi:hypothetical protein